MPKSFSTIELETLQPIDTEGKVLLPRDLTLFGHVNVKVKAEIGHAEISIDQVLATKTGDVLSLIQTVDTPITLLVNEKAIARGYLVAIEDNFGVQITEII